MKKNKETTDKFNNTTLYTRNFYKSINHWLMKKRFTKKSTWFWITILLMFSVSSLVNHPDNWLAWTCVVIAAILIPLFAWLIPHINDTQAYNRTRRRNNGRELTLTARFTDDEILFRNNMGQTIRLHYSDITSFHEEKGVLVFAFYQKDETYLNPDSFTTGDKESFIEMMHQKCPEVCTKPNEKS